MNKEYKDVLDRDLLEATLPLKVRAKLAVYFFVRPVLSGMLRLRAPLKKDEFYKKIDRYLWREGGLFKEYCYGLVNKYKPLKKSRVLVPGCGFGHNIYQLARFKPAQIIGYDLYEFKEEWKEVSKICKEKWGAEVSFLKATPEEIAKQFPNDFDIIITDAVLEHVYDMPNFCESSRKALKTGGIFFGTWGPVWNGQGGDHIDWGRGHEFDHLLLGKEQYEKKMLEYVSEGASDSLDPYTMWKEKLFSFLAGKEYLRIFESAGLRKILLWAKINPETVKFLPGSQLEGRLNEARADAFDRYLLGYLGIFRKQ